MNPETLRIPAGDGFELAADLFHPPVAARPVAPRVATINAATAVPRRFYRHFAEFLAARGFVCLTYDYRGIGGSRPRSLRGFRASATDWILADMAGVLDWVERELAPARLLHVGHSFGGQTAGLLPGPERIDAMIAVAAQSGHWRLQGPGQRLPVALHMHLTLPLLAVLCGYVPWSRLSAAEDLPRGVALQWARWCRHRDYLLGDRTLPLERFAAFDAPVLAYSIDDDAWGTARSVDVMMRAYSRVERRHVGPADAGVAKLGHVGFFRPGAERLWLQALAWFDALPA